jgi:carbon-monoxide dehydrogenase medium subunit
MRPSSFDYEAPTTVAAATEMLATSDRPVVVLAGGQTLVPRMIRRSVCPRLVVDIKRIDELDDIAASADGFAHVGPLVAHEQLRRSRQVQKRWPLLAEACRHVSNPVVRRRGTIGGSIAWRDGRSEIAAALVACDAELIARSERSGSRRVAVADALADGHGGLRDDELITDVLAPPVAGHQSWSVVEVGRRRWDPALGGAVCLLTWDDERLVPTHARVVAFGEIAGPRRLEAVEAALTARAGDVALDQAAYHDALRLADETAVAGDRGHLAAVLGDCARRAGLLAAGTRQDGHGR